MKRAWFDKHKIGCVNFLCEFHPNIQTINILTQLFSDEIAMRGNFSQTKNDYMAIPCDN